MLTDEQRAQARIVYPPQAMTGLRHVTIIGLKDERALCGVNVDGWYMEWKPFDPKTIGCSRCKATWNTR